MLDLHHLIPDLQFHTLHRRTLPRLTLPRLPFMDINHTRTRALLQPSNVVSVQFSTANQILYADCW